jgi:Flp pilus assembly protein TadG
MIRGESGQNTVEFTLIFLLFVMLTFGIVEGGRLIRDYGIVSQAAREGVRYASVRGSTCKLPDRSPCTASESEIRTYVNAKAIGLLTPENVTVSWPGPPAGNKAPGQTVSVQTTHPFQPLVWFIPSITLTSQSQLVIVR